MLKLLSLIPKRFKKKKKLGKFLTNKMRRKTVDIISALIFVGETITPDSRRCVLSSTRFPGFVDGIFY